MVVACKECFGMGWDTINDCSKVASNCCGGCEREVLCETCKGTGQVDIDTFEEMERNHEELHEKLLETLEEICKIYGKEFAKNYIDEVFLSI